ncbi:hypothetical protein ACP70R_024221 [Stipagrostis hirtigluma subsp. patula]
MLRARLRERVESKQSISPWCPPERACNEEGTEPNYSIADHADAGGGGGGGGDLISGLGDDVRARAYPRDGGRDPRGTRRARTRFSRD